MNKNYFFTAGAIALLGMFSFTTFEGGVYETYKGKAHKQNGGGQTNLTGAPGENNCTQCHAGTVQDGSSENTFVLADGFTPVSAYTPGVTYNVTLTLNSNPAKKGFSATVLDATNAPVGTLIGSGIGGTQDYSGGVNSRDYVSHTNTSNELTENSVWLWQWTAPATDAGPVTFYVASNVSNNSNTNAGDDIYTSFHQFNSTASVTEIEQTVSGFTAGYSHDLNKVVVDFTTLSTEDMYINVVDLNGRSVFSRSLGNATIGKNHQEVMMPSSLKNGIYVVNFFVGNRAQSSKIQIQK